MRSAVAAVLDAHGRIDVLVNNAGYGSFGPLEEVELAEGRRQFDVNVFGLARMTQLVLPAMRAAGQGRIINISSIGGKFYEPLGTWYHATKFAVEGLSDALRLELKPHGISVSIIEPASTMTEWGAISAEGLLASSAAGRTRHQAKEMAAVLASTGQAGQLDAARNHCRRGAAGRHRGAAQDALPGGQGQPPAIIGRCARHPPQTGVLRPGGDSGADRWRPLARPVCLTRQQFARESPRRGQIRYSM